MFPQKLEAQLQTAQQSAYRHPIVSCRLIVRTEIGDVVWPRRFPRPNEPMSEYLFCRKSLFSGEGIIGANTIFAMKELLQEVPFRRELQRHEDMDWLLRATILDGVGVQFVPLREPLVIWHREETHTSMSRRTDWRYSLAWINENKHLVTPRAYASFLMTWLSANAVREGDRKAFLVLLREAYQYGSPTALDAWLYFGIWLMPQRIRNRIRISFQKRDRRCLPALSGVRAVDVVAVADGDPDRLKRVADRFQAQRRYTNYLALLDDPVIEAVGVWLPSDRQVEVAQAVLAAGKHLFIDKPLVFDLKVWDRLIEQAAQSNRKIMVVGLPRRWHLLMRRARAVIQQGGLGKLELIRTVLTGRNPERQSRILS